MGDDQTDSSGNPASVLRIGTAPVNWNNNDLVGWRPTIPFPAILDEMVDAGYLETEWDESFGTDIPTLNRERDSRAMSFIGAYRWFDFANDTAFHRDLQHIAPFLETLSGIGARHLIVADSLRPHRIALAGSVPVDGSASLDNAGYNRIATNLHRLAEAAAAFNLRIHYHNHVGSYIETPSELASLTALLDMSAVDLCFDTGHFAFGGGDALAFIRDNLDAIGYLHLKDVDERILARAKDSHWSFLDALRNYIFCPLGDGHANIREIVGILRDHRFPHCVIIEQDTCREDATLNARHNLETARRYAGGAILEGSIES